MDELKEVKNPFKTKKGKGIKVYDSKRDNRYKEAPAPIMDHTDCNCSLCKISKRITREVRNEFNKYGKI